MRKLIGVLVVATLFAAGWAGSGYSGQDEQPRVRPNSSHQFRKFMQRKLLHTQGVLEGLVNEDYDAIVKNAQAVNLLTMEESWNVLQTEAYQQQSDEFRRIADDLTKAGRNHDLEDATLEYLSLTMKCIKCHKMMRGIRLAQKTTF